MTEPTFPLTFTDPWNEWQHVTQNGVVVRIRQVRTSGCAGGTWDDFYKRYVPLPSPRLTLHYAVSIDGRRIDSFLSFEAALRKAKALANA